MDPIWRNDDMIVNEENTKKEDSQEEPYEEVDEMTKRLREDVGRLLEIALEDVSVFF